MASSSKSRKHSSDIIDRNSKVQLNNGLYMPIFAFGCAQAKSGFIDRVELALRAGYRHFDTAWAYGTEGLLGRVLDKWISLKKIQREDLFITTKLPSKAMRPESVRKYLLDSLKALGLTYVDMYLIHTPFGVKDVSEESYPMKTDNKVDFEGHVSHIDIWREMEKAVKDGLTKSIGLSNFNEKQVAALLQHANIRPTTLQVELHLYFQQPQLRRFCRKENIVVSAYSPLSSPGSVKWILTGSKDDFTIIRKEDKKIRQRLEQLSVDEGILREPLILKYLIQELGVVVIPKSITPARLFVNINLPLAPLKDRTKSLLETEDFQKHGRIFSFRFIRGITAAPHYPFDLGRVFNFREHTTRAIAGIIASAFDD